MLGGKKNLLELRFGPFGGWIIHVWGLSLEPLYCTRPCGPLATDISRAIV